MLFSKSGCNYATEKRTLVIRGHDKKFKIVDVISYHAVLSMSYKISPSVISITLILIDSENTPFGVLEPHRT